MSMPKSSLILLLFLLSGTTVFSQDSLSVKGRYAGLNITGLLSQTPILPNNGESTGIYAFLFKSPLKKKPGKRFRLGVGGKVGIGDFSNAGFTVVIGVERTIMEAGRWQVNFGADGLIFFENSVVSAGVGIGYGPIVGISFEINKRISLLTEGSAFLTLSGGPNSGLGVNLRPPTGLIFVFKY